VSNQVQFATATIRPEKRR